MIGSHFSDALWGYMQRHWEIDLNAINCLTITGDSLPSDEAAVVISVGIGFISVNNRITLVTQTTTSSKH
jgi:hypothetical protein